MLLLNTPGDDVAFSAMCREHSWKRTSQRRAVFNYLCGNHDHPTVETVWRGVRKTLPDVSLDSVYRILDDFAEAGVIRRLAGGKVIRYDSDTTPHEHFVCRRCGVMHDFRGMDVGRVMACCGEFGKVESVELTVSGVCRQCLAEAGQLGDVELN